MDAEIVFATIVLTLMAAGFGLAGAVLLYRNSVTTLQFPFYADHELIEQVKATNKRLVGRQRLGFGLLCVSFILQMIGALTPLAPVVIIFI
jgi:hypothetical protein